MQIVSRNIFCRLIEKDKAQLVVFSKKKKKYKVQQLFEYVEKDSKNKKAKIVYDKFEVDKICDFPHEKWEKPIVFSIIEEVVAFLELEKCLVDDKIEILTINEKYENLESFQKAKSFHSINMEALLKKYLPFANKFVLVAPFDKKLKLDRKLAINIAEENTVYVTNHLQEIYKNLAKFQKKQIPNFGELIEHITEKMVFEKSISEIEKFKTMFAMSEMEASFIQYFYKELSKLSARKKTLEMLMTNKKEENLQSELKTPYYLQLEKSLIDTKLGFCWHCTNSDCLTKIFTFKIDDNSIDWLQRLKNDFDMKKLKDLAFYKDDILLFSSCTSEKFHIDFTELNKKFVID